MAGEATAIGAAIEQQGRGVLEKLGGLSDEQLNRRIQLPETNTLFQLATHLAGASEFWVLTLVGCRPSDRVRAAEFEASGSLQELRARYERWLQEVHDFLETLPDEALAKPAARPAR